MPRVDSEIIPRNGWRWWIVGMMVALFIASVSAAWAISSSVIETHESRPHRGNVTSELYARDFREIKADIRDIRNDLKALRIEIK